MSASQDSLARAIGGILWKWYEDLMTTIWSSKKKSKTLSPWQISQQLSHWEDQLAIKKKKRDDNQ
jgi:hypothetical protein